MPATNSPLPPAKTLFGHPAGLFTLFFAEMWERFSYYGMRALLLFYMLKGFLHYADHDAYAVYGAYTALVYMTPFFGGLLADRLLGARRAVVLGGLLMAAGHLLMTCQNSLAFFTALALLICGNGFFKPNISTIVGSLYPQGSRKRDGGFTIFYMGVNLGAAVSPLLCGYVGETFGWHYGFGLASIGMLTGIAVFVMPTLPTQIAIMTTAAITAGGLFWLRPDNSFSLVVNVVVGLALLVAGVVACVALGRGGIPAEAGGPPDRQRLHRPLLGPLSAEWTVYLAVLALVPLFALLVSGLAPLASDHRPVTLVADSIVASMQNSHSPLVKVLAVFVEESSRPAGLMLGLAELIAFVYVVYETFRMARIERQRMFVILVLTFFSMVFWSFFEQAGSSLNNFADRNVDRVSARYAISAGDVGRTIRIQPTQKQLGYHNGRQLFTIGLLDKLRNEHKANGESAELTIDWKVTADDVGMAVARQVDETPASTYQSINAVLILVFGLIFTALWGFLAGRGWEPSTPVKFSLGLLQLGLGFVAFWYGAQHADPRGMVALGWLFAGYLLHTTGELCLSPVGLAMVTRLAPARLVSTIMGTWFLATAFAQHLAAIIAQFTDVADAPPKETVHVYGDVFGKIAVAAIVSAAICLALSPLLSRWMHQETETARPTTSEGRGSKRVRWQRE